LPPGISGLFRLPERSRPSLRIDQDGSVVGEHWGYELPHRRRLVLHDHELVIEDQIEAAVSLRCRLNFNFDPAVRCESLNSVDDEVSCELRHSSGLTLRFRVLGGHLPSLGPGCFSVGYGVPVSNQCLSLIAKAKNVRTTITWNTR